MVGLLVLFSIVLVSGTLSGCGGGTSGPSVQSFSPQPRMSLAGFDNWLFGQASSSSLILAEFVMASEVDSTAARLARKTGYHLHETSVLPHPFVVFLSDLKNKGKRRDKLEDSFTDTTLLMFTLRTARRR